MTQLRTLHPKWPDVRNLDPQQFRFEYDRMSDILYWDFLGEAPPSITYPLTDHLSLSLDPATEAVTGYQIDGFLAAFVYLVPTFLDLAEVIGLTDEEVAAARARLNPDERTRAALRVLVGGLDNAALAPTGA